MRTGENPAKGNNKLDHRNYHRVLVPVYIPNLEGYFEQAVEVLRICLESLALTIHDRTAITVIDNASCPEAKALLQEVFAAGKIHALISNSENLGKVDALLSAARG